MRKSRIPDVCHKLGGIGGAEKGGKVRMGVREATERTKPRQIPKKFPSKGTGEGSGSSAGVWDGPGSPGLLLPFPEPL